MMRPPLLIALGVICAACSPSDPTAPDLDSIDLISHNSLAPAALTSNADHLATLAAGQLAGATTELVGTESGRSLLKYIARCALADGESASFPLPEGGTLDEAGLLGFAPEWATGALGEVGQRLMTGCLMAHVNAFEIEVPISVRATAIGTVSAEEAAQFPAQELAAYGNIFLAAAARQLNVCFGEAVAKALGLGGGVGGGRPTYLDLRICSTSIACGFNRVSACFRWPLFESIETTACETVSDSSYGSCHEKPIEVEQTSAWDEPVAVFLQQDDMDQMVQVYREQACSVSTLRGGIGTTAAACDSIEN